MSIRTVSQLPLLEVKSVIEKLISNDKFRNSLLEVSYNTEEGKYQSKCMKLGDYYDYCYYNILSGGDSHKTIFNTSVDFNDFCQFFSGVAISGDFFINKDFEDEEIMDYRTLIRNGTNTIYGVEYNNFIASETNISTDYLTVDLTDGTNRIEVNRNDITLNTNTTVNGNLKVNGVQETTSSLTVGNNLEVLGNAHIGGDLSAVNIHGGKFYGTTFYGVALCALWADLAETYESDIPYLRGTLVKFGGDKEITIADTEANAVITDRPGLILNSESTGCQIALTGRTPVRVIGPIAKFENVYLCPFQVGVGASEKYIRNNMQYWQKTQPIGKALKTYSNKDEKLVECVVQMTFN